MKTLPGCYVMMQSGSHFVVKPEHYDHLKSRLWTGDPGCIELNHVHGGKVLLRVEEVSDVLLVTPEHARAYDAQEEDEEKPWR